MAQMLPQVGDTIEVYSLSAKTWSPAEVIDITAVDLEVGVYDVVAECECCSLPAAGAIAVFGCSF